MRIKQGDMMNCVKAWLATAACFTLTLASAASAQEKQAGQTKQPATHRLEIYNGPYRTVHYFSSGETSAADQAKLRETERNENAAALSDQVHGLLRQYLANESALERRRAQVQNLYYGHSNVITEWLVGGQVMGAYPYAYDYYYPYNYNYYGPYYGYNGYGSGYTPGTVTSMNGLAGATDGGFKAELTRALAAQFAHAPAAPAPAK
jgi:hypothetical protein